MKLTDKILKHRNLILLLIIIFLGLLLRLNNINTPGGLWHDEIEGYTGASMSFPFGILDFIRNTGVHPPLYYFLLHFWIELFGNNDLYLRLFSVLFGTLTIITGYFIGCYLNSRNTGLLISLFIAVNSLLIYYSQEVRFYSLFVFFVSLSILFLLRLQNNPKPLNYAGFAVSSILCMYTSSLGLLFVFIEAGIYFLYLLKFKLNQLKPFIITMLVTLIVFLPYIGELIRHYNIANNGFISIFQWAEFTPVVILTAIQDWFTPVLINTLGYSPWFYLSLLAQPLLLLGSVIPTFIPFFICLFGIFLSLKTRNINYILLFLIALAFFLLEIILTMSGKLILLSKHTLPIALVMIILAASGLNEIKSIFFKRLLIVNYVLISMLIIIFVGTGGPNMTRAEGVKYVADLLNKYNSSPQDIILMPTCGRYLNKYDSNGSFNVLTDFDMLDTYYFPNKTNLRYIFDESTASRINSKNAFDLLLPYISDPNVAKPMKNYFDTRVLSRLKPGNKLFLVVKQVSCITSPEYLTRFKYNKAAFKKHSLHVMLSSKNYHDLIRLSLVNLKYLRTEAIGGWEIYIFQKVK